MVLMSLWSSGLRRSALAEVVALDRFCCRGNHFRISPDVIIAHSTDCVSSNQFCEVGRGAALDGGCVCTVPQVLKLDTRGNTCRFAVFAEWPREVVGAMSGTGSCDEQE